MTGRGKGGKGLDKEGAKRHRKVRGNIQGIAKSAIHRLARRGGVKRISGLIYEEKPCVVKVFLQKAIRESVFEYFEEIRRRGNGGKVPSRQSQATQCSNPSQDFYPSQRSVMSGPSQQSQETRQTQSSMGVLKVKRYKVLIKTKCDPPPGFYSTTAESGSSQQQNVTQTNEKLLEGLAKHVREKAIVPKLRQIVTETLNVAHQSGRKYVTTEDVCEAVRNQSKSDETQPLPDEMYDERWTRQLESDVKALYKTAN
jgi:histone H4